MNVKNRVRPLPGARQVSLLRQRLAASGPSAKRARAGFFGYERS
jgi:hypothetical protein